MDPSFESSFDASKCSKLSVDEKRELVYELSKWSGASEVLQSWSRQEILQVLCAEMGKERKYTGMTKFKMIEQLLKIVSENLSQRESEVDSETEACPEDARRSAKRQRKTDTPSQLPLQINCSASNNGPSDLGNAVHCKNMACKAILREGDTFCKRCSCCICHLYDDNKDPSLWLMCNCEPPYQGLACGMSCHLECALKDEASGIAKDRFNGRLDGSFRCVACGKVNDLLGCWKKQIITAKDTRRVDILCYRLSISHRLLMGTEKYQQLHKIVDEAVKKLEADVGPLTGGPVKMGRGIVNRLSSGPEVQKLCASALESLDKVLSSSVLCQLPICPTQDSDILAQTKVRFEDVCATSVDVALSYEGPAASSVGGCKLWYQKSGDTDYHREPTCTLFTPSTRYVVKGLSPETEYRFKVVFFNDVMELGSCEAQCRTCAAQEEMPKCSGGSQSLATNCSSLSNPSSVEDESTHNAQCSDRILNGADKCSTDGVIVGHTAPLLDDEQTAQVDRSLDLDVQNLKTKCLQDFQRLKGPSTENREARLRPAGLECVPFVGKPAATLPVTPCKLEAPKNMQGRITRSTATNKGQSHGTGNADEPQDGSTSTKQRGEKRDEECTANNHSAGDLEYHVKVVRWLECEGHLEKNFRQKFLTWYSLRANLQEIRVVKTFVDTLIEDPASLAEQLIDTFSNCVSNGRYSVVPAGFCMMLWH